MKRVATPTAAAPRRGAGLLAFLLLAGTILGSVHAASHDSAWRDDCAICRLATAPRASAAAAPEVVPAAACAEEAPEPGGVAPRSGEPIPRRARAPPPFPFSSDAKS